jgi:uncharacterized membrane protein YdjX (TVP38/TMEM64 family)
LAALLTGLIAIFLIFRQFPSGRESVASWAQQIGPLRFVLLATAACAAGVPRQAIAFAGGYSDGFWAGSALALICETFACCLNFCWARFVARNWVQARLRRSGRWQKWVVGFDEALATAPFVTTLTLRLLPVGNNLLLNIAAGVSQMPTLPFLCASALGYVPQTLIFALLGAGIAVDRSVQFIVAVTFLVASMIMGAVIMSRRRSVMKP